MRREKVPARAETLGGLQRLVESVRFGDPLLVSRKYGKGAVLAVALVHAVGEERTPGRASF